VWKKVMRVYLYAAFIGIVSIVPGGDFLYAAHVPFLPLAFPITVVGLVWLYETAKPSEKKRVTRLIMGSLVIYAVASLATACLASWSMERSRGFYISPLQLWPLFFFPLNLLFWALSP
jgi:hypothetical protein